MKKLQKFKVYFQGRRKMTVSAYSEYHARSQCSQYGLIIKVVREPSKLWYLIFPVVAAIFYSLFKVLAG